MACTRQMAGHGVAHYAQAQEGDGGNGAGRVIVGLIGIGLVMREGMRQFTVPGPAGQPPVSEMSALLRWLLSLICRRRSFMESALRSVFVGDGILFVKVEQRLVEGLHTALAALLHDFP